MYTSDERELKSDRQSVIEPPPGDYDTVTVTATASEDERREQEQERAAEAAVADGREEGVERRASEPS